MKFIIYLLIILLAAYGAYMLYDNYIKPPPPPPPATTAAPQARSISITCKTCKGRGRLVDTSGGVQRGYDCPICKGKGKATLPANTPICDYCGGWKRVKRPPKEGDFEEIRVRADKCPICSQAKRM